MSSREYLDAYIAQNNGVSATAARLGIAYSTLANIVNGYRGISPGMAQRMVKADPLLDANRLVWVRKTKPDRADGEVA